MKAEKYLISIEADGPDSGTIRYGFGAAGEEVQKILGNAGVQKVKVKIEGTSTEVSFLPTGSVRLVDIKQKIKALSFGSQ